MRAPTRCKTGEIAVAAKQSLAVPHRDERLFGRKIDMIVAIVTFQLPQPWTIEQAAAVFKSTAPKYLDRPGLVRKHYFLTDEGDRAGGIYFWQTRGDAQACYTREWTAMVTEKYGAAPDIRYAEVPVSVDNVTHVIEAS